MSKNEKKSGTVSTRNCPGKIEVPTAKEKEALDAMRSIKERVRAVKKQQSILLKASSDENAGEILELEEDLAHLKTEWDKWEARRRKAAKERMILLGHEKE